MGFCDGGRGVPENLHALYIIVTLDQRVREYQDVVTMHVHRGLFIVCAENSVVGSASRLSVWRNALARVSTAISILDACCCRIHPYIYEVLALLSIRSESSNKKSEAQEARSARRLGSVLNLFGHQCLRVTCMERPERTLPQQQPCHTTLGRWTARKLRYWRT